MAKGITELRIYKQIQQTKLCLRETSRQSII